MRPYKRVTEEIKLEGVRLIWRNFAGEKRQYNENGKRKFSIPLDAELAETLSEIGWNIKQRERVDDEGNSETLYHLDVTVKMDGRMPPRIFMITRSKNRRTPLDEDTVGLLDVAEFDQVDVIIRPFNWDVNGGKGVAAYLKTMFAFIHEDDLELKYSHIPIEGEVPELENIIDAQADGDSGWVNDADGLTESERKIIEPYLDA